MEPLSDRNSFGFRPGRNCYQAISYVFKRLAIRKSSTSKNKKISSKAKSTLKLKTKKFKIIEKLRDDDKQSIIDKIIDKENVSNQEIQKLLIKDKKLYYIL